MASCHKEEPMPEPPGPTPTPFFEIKWFTRIDSTKEVVGTDNTQHYKEWMIVTGDLSDPPTIIAINKETGKKEWIFVANGINKNKINNAIIYKNLYIGDCSNGFIAIDLDQKRIAWEINLRPISGLTSSGLIVKDGFLYHTMFKNFSTAFAETHVLKINLETGEFSTLFLYKGAEESIVSISPIDFYNDITSGKTYFVYNYSPNSNSSPPKSIQYIEARDLNTMEVLWTTKVTDYYATNGLHPPVIYKDIVITGGDWSMYGFDIKTGKQLWKTSIPGYTQFGIWNKTNHLIQGDRLYVNPGGFEVLCLNPATGAIIWNNTQGGPNCTDNMVYYKDMLLFTSWGYGSVMVLDALTGETLHRERPLPPAASGDTYNNDVVYDPETDMFFTSSYKNAVGFKINK
jgi:outer membrane protein assembly factor BamB